MGLSIDARLVSATGNQLDTLFDFDEPEAFDREGLRGRLGELAARGVRIGGSSWKYEGWLGQIYSRSRYQVRGKFSTKLFEETCIAEYAELFPTVCGDFAFYQFPTAEFWAKLFSRTPATFRWGLKVPEQVTVPRWPMHPRYGVLAGQDNPLYLDWDLFESSLLRPLEPYRERVGVLIFEFGTFRQRAIEDAAAFVRALAPFLERMPDGWRCAVEVRNAEFLRPEYFDCLHD